MKAANRIDDIQPGSWIRIRNPKPKRWPGPWIGWKVNRQFLGATALSLLPSVWPSQAQRIAAEINAGKRAGKLFA